MLIVVKAYRNLFKAHFKKHEQNLSRQDGDLF